MLRILRESRVPLDDDQIAQAAQMNRVYVNTLCRQLAMDGLIIRGPGADGKLVSVAVGRDQPASPGLVMDTSPEGGTPRPRPRRRSADWLPRRIQRLISGFARYVTAFEASQAFPGPSLYFHQRAIERRESTGRSAPF